MKASLLLETLFIQEQWRQTRSWMHPWEPLAM